LECAPNVTELTFVPLNVSAAIVDTPSISTNQKRQSRTNQQQLNPLLSVSLS
jgi:hypothetical protein